MLVVINTPSRAAEDPRQLVKLPEMMQQHMLSNMRDHLNTLNQILIYMSKDELGKAADIAEARVGIEVVLTPVTLRVVNVLKRAENEDYYDYDTKFSPFRLDV